MQRDRQRICSSPHCTILALELMELRTQTSWPAREPGILQPMDTQEKRLLNVQSMQGFPLRPEHCSPTKYAHLWHSPAGAGEGESEDELETQQFTMSALSQPAVAKVLQREKIKSVRVSS